jgi:hypothetical protein
MVALRRHLRAEAAYGPGGAGARGVGLVVLSGGVFRHADPGVVARLAADRGVQRPARDAGGRRPPVRAGGRGTARRRAPRGRGRTAQGAGRLNVAAHGSDAARVKPATSSAAMSIAA